MGDDELQPEPPAPGATAPPSPPAPDPVPSSAPSAPGAPAPFVPAPVSPPGPPAGAPFASPSGPPPPGQPAAPGGIYPAGAVPPAPPAPARSRGRLAVIGALLVVVLSIGGKLLLGLVTASVVGGALGTMFGGPYEKLPAEQRQQLEQRLDAALGDSLKGLSDTETSKRLDTLITAGLPRLDDAALIEHLRIVTAMLATTDVETCARIARSAVTGNLDEDAARKAVEGLDTATLGRWIEVNVSAIESQERGAPEARTPNETVVNTALQSLIGGLTPADAAALSGLSSGSGGHGRGRVCRVARPVRPDGAVRRRDPRAARPLRRHPMRAGRSPYPIRRSQT